MKKFSKSFLKDVERFEKQQRTMRQLETAYETYAPKYYAKDKRHNLLGNQFQQSKQINPYQLRPQQLRNIIKSNVQAIRRLGFTSQMSGDYAEALVLVSLNNEAYDVVDWYGSSPNAFDSEYEAMDAQEDVFGQMLYDSLRNLRLTNYQLNRVLGQSNLPEHIKEDIKDSLQNYWKSLRK